MVQPVAGSEATARAEGPGDETTPRWSPDGRYLAYVSTSEPGSPVYLVPPHGGAPSKLIDTGMAALDDNVTYAMGNRPWSPDSRTLLVARADWWSTRAIYRVDRDNGAAEQLTSSPGGSDSTRIQKA